MNAAWQKIEHLLFEAYQGQVVDYTQALLLAENLLAAWKPGVDPTGTLQQIQTIMDKVAASNAAILKARRQWQESGKTPGAALAEALQLVAQKMQRLADRIRQLQDLALAQKNKIVPELESLLRGRQMQRAYATATRKGQG
jgi:hypothetical protein